jgi:PucR C-terminal helix-turn-helix domain
MAATSAAADPQVGALAADLEGERDALAAGVAERIRREIPAFVSVPAATLESAVRGNMSRALAALRELRPPTPEELERAAQVGRERAEQGLALDAVLQAYRMTVSAVRTRMGTRARERELDVATVLALAEALWLWADAVMDAVGAAHREVELQLAQAEQQRRDAFVLAALLGTLDATELSRDAAAHGLDPERPWVPFRSHRAPGDERPLRAVARELGAAGALVAVLDHDLAGFAAAVPPVLEGVMTGIGPAVRLAELPRAFAVASRALQTALAFEQPGVCSLADLSIRPAVLADAALGDALVARHLAPLEPLGRHGAELEETLRTWLGCGMHVEDTAKAMHLHANSVRHRLRRYEDATGASLKRTGDLVELWWALERRRLRAADADGT